MPVSFIALLEFSGPELLLLLRSSPQRATFGHG
jgi:hypothetical protein